MKMNKYQEALNNIKSCNCTDCVCDDIRKIQELVDRATPKKCKFENVEVTESDTLDTIKIFMYVCPNCSETIGTRLRDIKFCHNCGQRLE